ncbi:hypothetical protein K1719_041701 [Acacia pycnantha]|nr:hypothetical protein K1719_041701 [Acacia pycnantha]
MALCLTRVFWFDSESLSLEKMMVELQRFSLSIPGETHIGFYVVLFIPANRGAEDGVRFPPVVPNVANEAVASGSGGPRIGDRGKYPE